MEGGSRDRAVPEGLRYGVDPSATTRIRAEAPQAELPAFHAGRRAWRKPATGHLIDKRADQSQRMIRANTPFDVNST